MPLPEDALFQLSICQVQKLNQTKQLQALQTKKPEKILFSELHNDML